MTGEASTTWKLVVAYNGSRFKGWQRGNGRTVQATLEEAIATLLAADESLAVQVNGAGRTDAGVHAEGQVASVVLPAAIDRDELLVNLNRALPGDVAVLDIERADDRFHARYLARSKTYRYRIVDGPVANPFLAHLAWRQQEPLHAQAMRDASRLFVGTHDFSGFTKARSDKSSERTVRSVQIDRTTFARGPVLEITVRGDGFLWKQIRAMVGALVAVGAGRATPDQIETLLRTGDRTHAPPVAPASGLTLVSVDYSPSPDAEP